MARKPAPQPSKSKPKPPKTKARKLPPPNLPQHDFPPPYSRLLALGDRESNPDPLYDAIAAELLAGDARDAAAKLLEITLDETYYQYWQDGTNEDDPRLLTRVHAVNVLARLGEVAHASIAPLLPLLGEEDDYLREEMPLIFGKIGRPAMAPLTELLMDVAAHPDDRIGAGDALAEIGEAHPEARDEIIAVLERIVATEQEDEDLVGFVIMNLMDLGAKESVPIIQQAFEEDRASLFVVEMADVEEHFDLPRVSPRVDWNEFLSGVPAPENGNDAWQDEFEVEDEGELEAEAGFVPRLVTSEPETVAQPYVAPPKVGRNDPCPCGSGKKYKKCCGA